MFFVGGTTFFSLTAASSCPKSGKAMKTNLTGRQIYDDAIADIDKIMEKFRLEEDEGPMFFMG